MNGTIGTAVTYLGMWIEKDVGKLNTNLSSMNSHTNVVYSNTIFLHGPSKDLCKLVDFENVLICLICWVFNSLFFCEHILIVYLRRDMWRFSAKWEAQLLKNHVWQQSGLSPMRHSGTSVTYIHLRFLIDNYLKNLWNHLYSRARFNRWKIKVWITITKMLSPKRFHWSGFS